jgi:hypothetical protein
VRPKSSSTAFKAAWLAPIGAFLVAFAGSLQAQTDQPQTGQAAVTCTNPASGASWQIRIDYDHATVDANPARISGAAVTWRDEKLWNYSLDRKSGRLTIILASATGGNFLYADCKLPN